MSSLKDKFKSMSFLERKREKERKVAEVLESKADEQPVNVQPDDFLKRAWMRMIQYSILSYFGFLTIVGIGALVFYLMDLVASMFDGMFDDYIDYVLLFVVFLSVIGSIV